jgi:plasmid stabilization system protein ParE
MKLAAFHPDAAEEARNAAAYYEGIRAGLGTDFQAELESALSRIRENPLMYAVESAAKRICPLHRFPYSVVYKDLEDRIWVVAVAHQRRRPRYWGRRN